MHERSCTMPGCVKPHRARGLCSTHYNQANRKPALLECTACGGHVLKGERTKRRVVCSYKCRAYLQNGPASSAVPDAHASRSTRVPITHPSRSPFVIPRGSCKVFLPDCQVCGRVFATPYTVSTCSDVCARIKKRSDKREHEHRRRARKRDAYVAPVFRFKIYERDRWVCHLCNKRVHKGKAAPHPMAPVLDHVIPLSRGGTHEPANVRTAHFMCNCIKSDGGGNEQLMLIG